MRASAPGLFFLIRLLTGLVGISTPILLARALSVTDFATYAMIIAASGLMHVITNLGLDRACLRLLPAHAGAVTLPGLLRFMAMLSLPRMLALSLVLVIVIATGIWRPEGSGVEHSALLLVAISLSTGATQLASAFMQGLLLQAVYAVIVFATVIVRFVVLAILFSLRDQLSYELVIEVFIGTELLSLLAQSLALAGYALKWSNQGVAMPSWREVMTISRANYFSYLSGIPWLGNSLILLVGYFASHELTAAFAFFQNLVERARQFMPIRLLQSLVEPQWARLHQTDGRVRRFQAPLATLQKTHALLLSFGLVLIVVLGDTLLRQFTQPLYADQLLLLILILVQQAMWSIAELLWMGLNATNQVDKLTRASVLVSAGAAPLLIPAVNYGGVEGLIIWTWVPSLLLLLLLRRAGAHFAGLPHQSRKTVLFLVVGLTAGWIGWAIQSLAGSGLQAMAAAGLASTVVWLAMVWGLRPFNRAERYLLKRFVTSRKSLRRIGVR